jgi:hypothetical protein
VQVEFSNEPVEVPKGEGKPYEIKVNDEVIYSMLAPVNGEKGPINFEENKWFGPADPGMHTPPGNFLVRDVTAHFELMLTCVQDSILLFLELMLTCVQNSILLFLVRKTAKIKYVEDKVSAAL